MRGDVEHVVGIKKRTGGVKIDLWREELLLSL
jgi:hypothetical protein